MLIDEIVIDDIIIDEIMIDQADQTFSRNFNFRNSFEIQFSKKFGTKRDHTETQDFIQNNVDDCGLDLNLTFIAKFFMHYHDDMIVGTKITKHKLDGYN